MLDSSTWKIRESASYSCSATFEDLSDLLAEYLHIPQSFEITFSTSAPDNAEDGTPPEGTPPSPNAAIRSEGNIVISSTTGLRGRVTLSNDGTHYRITSVGDLRVHQGQMVMVTDPAVTSELAPHLLTSSAKPTGIPSPGFSIQATAASIADARLIVGVDERGLLMDLSVTISDQNNVVIGKGIGSTATFGLRLPAISLAVDKSVSPAFGLGKAPLRVIRPSHDLLGCAGTIYPLTSAETTDWIALVQRGQCSFFEKLHVAAMAGAAGVLVWEGEEASRPGEAWNGDGMDRPLIRPSAEPGTDDVRLVEGVGMVYLGDRLGKALNDGIDDKERRSEEGVSGTDYLTVTFEPVMEGFASHAGLQPAIGGMSGEEGVILDLENDKQLELLFSSDSELVGSSVDMDMLRKILAMGAGGSVAESESRGAPVNGPTMEQINQLLAGMKQTLHDALVDENLKQPQKDVENLPREAATTAEESSSSAPVMMVAGLPVINLIFGPPAE